MEMQDTEMIDFELWLVSMIRAICHREGVRLPSIARADELLDERLSLQRGPGGKPGGNGMHHQRH
jgi:hypothetical protein